MSLLTSPALRRVLGFVAVLLVVSTATMLLLDVLPGGPADAILGASATPDQVQALEDELGVNDPFPARLWDWISDLATGDFGRSWSTRQPVADAITERLPVTLELALGAMAIALLLAVPLAVYSAHREGGLLDRCVQAVMSLLLSIPSFLLAVVLILLLAVKQNVFPVIGWVRLTDDPWGNLEHAFLPMLTLALAEAAAFTRLLRNDMVATLQEDFVLAARARGLPTRRVLFRHALRPSSFSLVTIAGVSLGRLIGGSVIVAVVFALPGLGQLLVQAISSRDYIVVRSVVVLAVLAYLALNALVDAVYPLLDPRVRERAA